MNVLYPPRTREEEQAMRKRYEERWAEARERLAERYLLHPNNKLTRKING